MALGDKDRKNPERRQALLETENAKLQAEVRSLTSALAEAEQASEVKSRYLENMSHEIRTSMNGIVGLNSLLLETGVDDEQQQYIEMISDSVERLLEVVNEVLDFSEIERGQVELDSQDFNLKRSLDHDLYLLRQAAEQKGLRLTCDIDPDVPAHINGDPRRLVQILTNLVNNGIRYTDRGAVSIYVKNDGYDDDNRLQLHFAVHDTGKGIGIEQQKRIFQAFTADKPGVQVSSGGPGIGLAVCSQLVRQMAGEIGLASSHKGSVFWFSIPFKEAAVPEEEVEESPMAAARFAESMVYALRGARVLLAEDEPINRVMTETLLKQAGVVVTSVENGRQAVEEARQGEHEIILMDVQMPEMDGLEATRQIRREEKNGGSRRTIIALTAFAMQGDREKCLQAGMDDYLSKPIDKEQLLDMLSKYLTSSALVVDSDLDSQQLLIRTLIESGWSVTLAETGRSAMYEASLNRFDLILLDTNMPQVDGIEAARVIRKLEEYSGQHARIVGIGSGDESEKQRCLENGIDYYMDRPVTRDKVSATLSLTRE